MKVTCDVCQTKYTIADEKVAGRAYRVRCKKCGTTFVVRGDGETETVPADAGTSSADAVWHVLVSGVQRGPLAPAEIRRLLEAGEATLEHYAWRDSLDGWKPMREIPELAVLAEKAAAPAPPPAPPPQALFVSAAPAKEPEPDEEPAPALARTGGIFAPESPAAGLFAKPLEPLESTDEEPIPLAASSGGRASTGADLFAALGGLGAAAPEPETAAPEPAPSAMTGVRNENSVLFSLSSLQSLATTPAKAGGAASAPSSSDDGFPSLSGLRPIEPLGAKADAIDDLINLGGASPFQPALGAPILAPAPPQREGRGLLYALFGVAFILLAGIIVLVFLLMSERAPVARQGETARSERGEGRTEGEPAQAEPALAPASAAPASAAPETAAPASATPGDRNSRERDRDPEQAPATAAPERREREPEKRAEPEDADPLAQLINKAVKQGPADEPAVPRTAAPPPPAGGPASPDRAAVMSAMNSVSGAVTACAGAERGTAQIRVTFAGGSGRVTTAQVVGAPFAGTPAGSCMARAVRAASVPPFSNPSLTVTFPFAIR